MEFHEERHAFSLTKTLSQAALYLRLWETPDMAAETGAAPPLYLSMMTNAMATACFCQAESMTLTRKNTALVRFKIFKRDSGPFGHALLGIFRHKRRHAGCFRNKGIQTTQLR